MFLKIKITIYTIFCALFLMSFGVSAQTAVTPKTSDKTTKSASTPAAKQTKIEFPEIEEWEKGEIREYPTPELGYSISYQSESNATVSIFVYNGGNKSISNGVVEKVIKDEFDQAKSDIYQIGKMGRYSNVKEIKSESIMLGGKNGKVKALHSIFSFNIGELEVNSAIYLFGYQNNFIKIRITHPKSEDENVKPSLNILLTELDKTFAK